MAKQSDIQSTLSGLPYTLGQSMKNSLVHLKSPVVDLAELNDQLGCAWGVTSAESIPQYLAWSEASGIFSFLAGATWVTPEEICANTALNQHGVAALVPILSSLRLLHKEGARYKISALAEEYLLKESPYYVGIGLYLNCDKPIPSAYVSDPLPKLESKTKKRWPYDLRLKVPHSRNFAPCVTAARTGEFDHTDHLVDIGAGSGVLAIPLALDGRCKRITLIELPDVIERLHANLASYNIAHRVDLIGMDIFKDEWHFPSCDGIFFGNFFHTNDDEACAVLARRSFAKLSRKGKIWVHEVLFNENQDGPLIAALWNANIIVQKPTARQRTGSQIINLLHSAGFKNCYTIPTAGQYSLVVGTKL